MALGWCRDYDLAPWQLPGASVGWTRRWVPILWSDPAVGAGKKDVLYMANHGYHFKTSIIMYYTWLVVQYLLQANMAIIFYGFLTAKRIPVHLHAALAYSHALGPKLQLYTCITVCCSDEICIAESWDDWSVTYLWGPAIHSIAAIFFDKLACWCQLASLCFAL